MSRYDAIVLGTGGVGSAALYHLARRGARALGLDRFPPGHDRGSSHGRTRIIRQAYFEHPDYVPLVLRAYQLWAELSEECGQALYRQTGLLQIGPPDGQVVQGVLESARRHALPIEELRPAEVERSWPGFHVDPRHVGLMEERAGYLRVEACVVAHLEAAMRLGADLQTGEAVAAWQADGSGVAVEVGGKRVTAERLVIAAGPWAGQVLADLEIPLVVRRKPQYWFEPNNSSYDLQHGCPAFLYETPRGLFYGFPRIDELGVKVARHSGGETVDDPLGVNRQLDSNDLRQVEEFTAEFLPALSPRLTQHSVCMYTMTRDEHFVVDRHPHWPPVVFAAGLSGHGFKFAPVLGEVLAELALAGQTDAPIGFLSVGRFRT